MLSSKWFGIYNASTKWGGATGTWQPFKAINVSLNSGSPQVLIDGVPQQNVVFAENKITFKNADGSSGEMNFSIGSKDSYYFGSSGTNAVCFVGVFQPHAGSGSGPLDLQGILAEIPLSAIWFGNYQTELGWGGFQNWKPTQPLMVTPSGISFGTTKLTNLEWLSASSFKFANSDGSSGTLTFSNGLINSPFYNNQSVSGIHCTGFYQPPTATGSGGNDFRAVKI